MSRRHLAEEVERLAQELRTPLLGAEEALAALISGDGLPPGLPPHVLFEGGMPRMRPVLVLLAAKAATHRDMDPQAAMDVAAIAELLDTAVLLHDMALGRRDGRRRRAARRVLRGATTWLGASHVTLRALELARRAPTPEILGEALEALRDVSESHALRQSLKDRPATAAEVLHLAEGRNGALFSFACRAGGHLAHANRVEISGLGRYGRHVGVALQLSDDLHTFEKGPRALGDAAVGRTLFPVAWAHGLDPRVDPLWRRLGDGYDAALAVEVEERVRAAGGLTAAREALVKESWAARKALGPLSPSPARESLAKLAASVAA